jgi:hypothetical protein
MNIIYRKHQAGFRAKTVRNNPNDHGTFSNLLQEQEPYFDP